MVSRLGCCEGRYAQVEWIEFHRKEGREGGKEDARIPPFKRIPNPAPPKKKKKPAKCFLCAEPFSRKEILHFPVKQCMSVSIADGCVAKS